MCCVFLPLSQVTEDSSAGGRGAGGAHGGGGLSVLAARAVARGRGVLVQHYTQQELKLGCILYNTVFFNRRF